MHATIIVSSMDSSKKAQLIEELGPKVIPMVREMPGYISGFWSWDHATNVTYAFILFEREDQARALESAVKADPIPGARLERVVTAEVVGAASGNAARKVDGANLWARLGASGSTAAATATTFFTLVERKQLDAAFALLADELVVHGPAPVPLGKREFMAVFTAWANACSDFRFNCDDARDLGQGKVKTTIAISATLDGDLVGLPVPGLPPRVAPTGKKAQLPTEEPVFTIVGGKITAITFATPPGGGIEGMLAQMGVR